MRGYAEFDKKGEIVNGGTLVFFFDDQGHALGLDFYKDWLAGMGPKLKPGQSVGCCCENGTILLACPIHAVDLGPDFEGL